MVDKYILSGGPCTGKTSLLNKLAEKGYITLPESARLILEEEQAKEEGIFPWNNQPVFQLKMIERQLVAETEIQYNEGIAFLDRSIIDAIGYYRFYGLDVPEHVPGLIEQAGYKKVFFLEQLGTYANDVQRKESAEEARVVHNHLHNAYKESICPVIDVPDIGLDARVDFILKNLFL